MAEELLERLDWHHLDECRAPALLGRLIGNLLPALLALDSLLAVVAHDTVVARDRHNAVDAELDGLLHDKVHLVGLQEADGQDEPDG